MKGSKRKGEPKQASQPQNDENYNGDDDDVIIESKEEAGAEERMEEDKNDEGEEDVDDEEETDEGIQAEAERPNLDEGFYEIEDVRRKRVRKGQLQYLIKWRGWPETANTWEPLENLQSCSDIIEAFEESLRSGKSSRKRKRKHGGLHSHLKKKQQSSKSLTGDEVSPSNEPLLPAHFDNSSFVQPPVRIEVAKEAEGKGCGIEEEKHKDSNNVETTSQPTEDNSTNISLELESQKEGNEAGHIISNLMATSNSELNAGKFSIHFPDTRTTDEDGPSEGLLKVDCAEPVQSNRFIGAKKRKSGCVRRFKQEPALCEADEAQNAIARSTFESCDRIEALGIDDSEYMGNDAGDKIKFDDSTNPPTITKIIQPVGYSASISNDLQDISVTFKAMRSDGKEVVVDNKFLKVNNPLLLISYYEQHLRYSPT